MFNQIKGSFYTLFFILLNLLYLVVELSFNARVLDVSASFSPDMDFGQLEVYGRTISACGATLLAWRLLVPYHATLNLLKLVIKFFIIALIVFPLVFVGQKKLVDELVNQSSNETRRTAEILSLLKFGIANGFVEIEELAVDELTLQTPEGKMFITLSGLLAYNSSHMRQVLERELEKIAGYAIATQQMQVSQRLYKNYRYAQDQILLQYGRYQQMVNELEQQQSRASRQAIESYETAMNSAMLHWLQYQESIKLNPGIEKISQQQLNSLQQLFDTAQHHLNICESETCVNDVKQMLELKLARLLGFFSSLSDWCREKKAAQGGTKLICVSEGQALPRQIIHKRKLALAINAGLTQVYETKLDYLKSRDLRSNVFASLQQQGYKIDSSWNFKEYERMLESMAQQLRQNYLEKYYELTLAQFSFKLEPRIKVEQFNLIPDMQDYYIQALGDMYQSPMVINMTQQAFDDALLAPVYFARFNLLVNKLKADQKWYAAEAPYEQSGKSSLRNLLVPPVAIAFSLVFGLLNMVNLMLNFIFLLIEERLWLRWLGVIVLGFMILILPMRHSYQIYNQPAYLDLLSETAKNHGSWASVMDWIARTEPLVFPLGNILRYNVLKGFSFD